MEKTIKVINELKKRGLIKDYAIGGGIATIFYVEPFLTYDLDVFIIPSEKVTKKGVVLLSAIFDYLKAKGYHCKGEHIIIDRVPVQFIPADKLEEEAIASAKQIKYKRVPTKVMTPEYLIPVLLRAGIKKDVEKIEKLLGQTGINMKKLNAILAKYQLAEKFKRL